MIYLRNAHACSTTCVIGDFNLSNFVKNTVANTVHQQYKGRWKNTRHIKNGPLHNKINWNIFQRLRSTGVLLGAPFLRLLEGKVYNHKFFHNFLSRLWYDRLWLIKIKNGRFMWTGTELGFEVEGSKYNFLKGGKYNFFRLIF